MYILGLDVRLKECELLHVNVCKLNKKWIPVGCIPAVAVAVSGWQYLGLGRPSPAMQTLYRQHSPKADPTFGFRCPLPLWTDRRFWKHYLPLRSVIMYKSLAPHVIMKLRNSEPRTIAERPQKHQRFANNVACLHTWKLFSSSIESGWMKLRTLQCTVHDSYSYLRRTEEEEKMCKIMYWECTVNTQKSEYLFNRLDVHYQGYTSGLFRQQTCQPWNNNPEVL